MNTNANTSKMLIFLFKFANIPFINLTYHYTAICFECQTSCAQPCRVVFAATRCRSKRSKTSVCIKCTQKVGLHTLQMPLAFGFQVDVGTHLFLPYAPLRFSEIRKTMNFVVQSALKSRQNELFERSKLCKLYSFSVFSKSAENATFCHAGTYSGSISSTFSASSACVVFACSQ